MLNFVQFSYVHADLLENYVISEYSTLQRMCGLTAERIRLAMWETFKGNTQENSLARISTISLLISSAVELNFITWINQTAVSRDVARTETKPPFLHKQINVQNAQVPLSGRNRSFTAFYVTHLFWQPTLPPYPQLLARKSKISVISD